MKNILKRIFKSTKGKVITAVSATGIVCAVVLAVIFSNRGYRTIVVDNLTGDVKVTNEGNLLDAFLGQKLIDGDEVNVPKLGDMTLFC